MTIYKQGDVVLVPFPFQSGMFSCGVGEVCHYRKRPFKAIPEIKSSSTNGNGLKPIPKTSA
jgi:hypothetical protein